MSHEWYDVSCPSTTDETQEAHCTVSPEYAAQLWLDQNRLRWMPRRALLVVLHNGQERLFRIARTNEHPPTVVETTQSCYVVQLYASAWILKTGTALFLENAQQFKTKGAAQRALNKANNNRHFSYLWPRILRLAVDEVLS